ncbi:MAG: hypothetical protein EZS28_028067 [Streblomastix strix]|uniref:Uncharacterized protein n=1 Tax=Streblomastix strix TaxID=222440 RepID=A0A5J4V0A2_9EUKA|nr:MAG: hypothetical protein EZS28_028067 [Streblomastix strix]
MSDKIVESVLVGFVICISFSTAGGIGEEQNMEIGNGLIRIYNFLREQHEGRYFRQPFFQPLPLLARRTEEQIEEEGAVEEMEAQMKNKGYVQGYYEYIKNWAKWAKAEILNHFIQW